MLCSLQKFKRRVLFQNRNKLKKKIVFLPAAIIARGVCSCIYLRSRDFGSMKDSLLVEDISALLFSLESLLNFIASYHIQIC